MNFKRTGVLGAIAGASLSASPAIAASPLGNAADTPIITQQPLEQILQVDQQGGFLVVATNATSYQWYMTAPGSSQPQAVPGGTGAFLLTAPAKKADSGEIYSVVVTGSGGSISSSNAQLLIGPKADGSPFFSQIGKIGRLAKAKNVMNVKFVNASQNVVPDTQMFWSIQYTDANGNPVSVVSSFADQSVFDMPVVGGTRIYFYVAPTIGSIGTGSANYFDFIEVNVGQHSNDGTYWINMDTTRVDRWGLPIAFRLSCADSVSFERGDDAGVFNDNRTVTLMKYQAQLGAPWDAAAATTIPYGIDEPGASGFGQGGPYANYYTDYINTVWSDDGLTIPKPTNFLNLDTQLPDLSAALNRHVADSPGSFNPDGSLADSGFWSKHPPSTFYQSAPANFYAAYWHQHAVKHLQYGFPYDDDDGQSSDVGCTSPKTLIVGVGY